MSLSLQLSIIDKNKISVVVLVIGLIFPNYTLHAGESCTDLYNSKSLKMNLDSSSEFALRLSERDFQTFWESTLDPSIVIVRYPIGDRSGHYAARVVEVTRNGDLEVITLLGEKVTIRRTDLSSAKMGGVLAIKTFENHEQEFDPPYQRTKNKRVVHADMRPAIANAKESTRDNTSLFSEYKNTLNKVAPLYNSKILQNSDSVYIGDGYWREWISDGESPDQGWKLHVSAPIEMASKMASAILPKLREKEISHKIVFDLPAYAANDSTNTQHGKFITIYPKNDREAVSIRNFLTQILLTHKLNDANFPIPPGELQLAPGIFARYGRFNRDALFVKGRKILGTEYMLLLPNGRIIRDERGGPTPEGIQNPF